MRARDVLREDGGVVGDGSTVCAAAIVCEHRHMHVEILGLNRTVASWSEQAPRNLDDCTLAGDVSTAQSRMTKETAQAEQASTFAHSLLCICSDI